MRPADAVRRSREPDRKAPESGRHRRADARGPGPARSSPRREVRSDPAGRGRTGRRSRLGGWLPASRGAVRRSEEWPLLRGADRGWPPAGHTPARSRPGKLTGSSRPAGAGEIPAPIAGDRPLKAHFTKNGRPYGLRTECSAACRRTRQQAVSHSGLGQMFGRLILYGALALAIGIVVVSACGPQPDVASPLTATPTPSASRSATPTTAPSASPSATATVRPSTSATSVPSASPGSSPAAACPRTTGGNASNQAQLVAVRVAHQPRFDRLVFEFGQSTAPGTFGMPAYTVEAASSLSGPSGQPVTIGGNALFGARFQNASTQNPNGTPSYTGSNDMKPTTPLIKEVKLVEDFERVLLWGVGLDHLACPKVSELAGPFRLVLDFPTPP